MIQRAYMTMGIDNIAWGDRAAGKKTWRSRMGPWENPPFTRRTEVIVRPRKTDQVRANITDKEMHLQQK